MLDLSFQNVFLCLDIDNILTILANLLLERKILFRSRFASLVTDVAECLVALLFPLAWQGSFIPRLTVKLLEYIDCPGALLVGVHDETTTTDDETRDTMAAYHGIMTYVNDMEHVDLVVVDLDRNLIQPPRIETIPRATVNDLPPLPRKDLKERLEDICQKAGIRPGQGIDPVQVDMAFDMAPIPLDAGGDADTVLLVDDNAVRDAALCFLVKLLDGYVDHLEQPEVDWQVRNESWFNRKSFLDAAHMANKPLLAELVNTQMFSYFEQKRSESSESKYLYFDRCLQHWQTMTETDKMMLVKVSHHVHVRSSLG